MKKALFILAAICMTMAANAKILRVSNITGSSAPYTTFEAAQAAAEIGDTIMFDGSSESYGTITIEKTLVIIGPGYFFGTNDISEENLVPAKFAFVNVEKEAEGTVIEGLYVTYNLVTKANKTVIKRCRIIDESWSGGGLTLGAINCVAHQNIVNKISSGAFYVDDYSDQITNNLILGGIDAIGGSYIAYNTFIVDNTLQEDELNNCFSDVIHSTIEKNIIPRTDIGGNGWNDTNVNTFIDNYVYGPEADKKIIEWDLYLTDKEIKEATKDLTSSGYGAFANNSPYVLSGIPAGPVIQDLVIPATVEMGSMLNVTIIVGVQP